MSESKVSILGCGAFALAIANMLASKGKEVVLWAYSDAVADEINRNHSRDKLPGIPLHSCIKATSNMQEALHDVCGIVVCMPSQFILKTIELWTPYFNHDIPVLCLSKGIVSEKELLLSDVFIKRLKHLRFALLSGPNLALEIAQGKPAASVIASRDTECAHFFQRLLSSDVFRTYTSSDIIGVACGGVLKNIMAIAAGCIDTLGLGLNTKSVLMSRGLAEMQVFGEHLGAEAKTFFGLSGMGDLIATCSSPLSRNYQVGQQIGKGASLTDIRDQFGSLAEGVYATKYVYAYAKENQITLPITKTVYNVLFHQQDISTSIYTLMTRDLKAE